MGSIPTRATSLNNMEAKTKRVQDSLNSKEVEKFLDLYLYKDPTKIERVNDKVRQLMGIDVIYNNMFIDEKCALDYINKPLSTFLMEISSINKSGNRYDGWLINEKLATTHYLFCYINSCEVDENPLCENIKEMEVILVSKKKIIGFIEENCDKLSEIVRISKSINGSHNYKGFRIIQSKHKVESPINILIKRDDLRQMSVASKIIKPL